ncbi:MAG: cob(I)yrinic acid a,c-diamide adenosyltransferase [Lachnospiraceae bacterium]|nr:cob(I)yrinic acid a,c-diamide adenosyltransferase [Lachnospiraceae bacterium]
MIQLYCGDGKGKTTAAVGAAVRAAGNDRNVIFAQFMKGRPTGEVRALGAIDKIRVLRNPEDFGFFSGMSEEQKRKLTEIHNRMLEEIEALLVTGRADFVVLDEITHAVRYGLADMERLQRILAYGRTKRAGSTSRQIGETVAETDCEIILTGREPSEELLEYSDYISEIRCVRHPFQRGVAARPGIEY